MLPVSAGGDRGCPMKYPDIYFEPDYAKLYVTEGDRSVEFEFRSELGLISNLFIKRRIPVPVDGQQYYDIITPYGYGGPVIRRLEDPDRKNELIQAYVWEFEKYARENRIVSEFVRFHPLVGNGVDFKEAYNGVLDRKTVGTDLTYADVIGTEFSKHRRKDIRRTLNHPGIRYEIDERPGTLRDFIPIYYSTMDRDEAGDSYYFGEEYFDHLLAWFPENIITAKVFLDDKTIAMGVYFRYGRFLHAHLSGTLTEYLEYSPAYILKYALALYGHEHGYDVIHYGGGSSRDPGNGLYRFKKEFGKNTEFDFYIGKKIWDAQVYKKLCALTGAGENGDFFPAYRSGIGHRTGR